MNKKRLKEPSTWSGLAAIFLAIIPAVPVAAVPLGVAAGICGGIAVILREGKPE